MPRRATKIDPTSRRMPARSLYGQPAIYDLLFHGWSADLAHYLSLAEALRPASILECAVGSGRVALHLARAGHRVHGVDLDPAMLEALATRAAQEPSGVQARLSWALGDLRALDTGRRHGLVLAPFNALGHLHSSAELAAFLGRVRAELEPGGTFAFDVWLPSEATLAGRVSDSPRFRDPRTQEPMRCTETTRVDPATGLLHVELALHGLDGDPPEVLAIALRVRDDDTLSAALTEAGLRVCETVELGEMQGWICQSVCSGLP